MAQDCFSLDPRAHLTAFPDSFWTPYTLPHDPTLPSVSASASASISDSGSNKIRQPALPGPAGKISKRKSRAGKTKSSTTFIAADPANFRFMVQQVTGVRLGTSEPVRSVAPQCCLPTLNTSSLLLSCEPPVQERTGFFEFEPETAGLPCFPTLESWGVM